MLITGKKIPLNQQIYDSVYGDDLPNEQYYLTLFGRIPSKFEPRPRYSKKIIDYFQKDLGFVLDAQIYSDRKTFDRTEKHLLVNIELEMIIKTTRNLRKGEEFVSVEIMYNIDRGRIQDQIKFSKFEILIVKEKKSNIHLLRSDEGGLSTEEFDLPIPECDIELNYGKEFLKLHETIVKRLNTPTDKGIILFHGEPGTGKTTYIKLLTKLIKNKDVLFIPPSMAESLSDPSFIPFLMDHRDSILLIEDAEKVIGDRDDSGSQAGVSNLLNLTDGILGDCLNIQVIATFNMDRKRIDQALLRKGRLIGEHKFEKLTVSSTNALLKHLGKGVTSTKPLTLADIYNIETDVNRTSTSSSIGFKKQ